MPGSLTGQILIATPAMGDPRFERAVILICNHDEDGAMGLVINQPKKALTLGTVLSDESIEINERAENLPVLVGGPVDTARGFVLHSTDFISAQSGLDVSDDLYLSSTQDALFAMVSSSPPRQSLFALGYSGWSAGQLEEELLRNAWLTATPNEPLIFDHDYEGKWNRALAILGVKPEQLSHLSGHA